MISIIITAKDEAKTISEAISPFLGQGYEIIIVAPDKETLRQAKKSFNKIYPVKSGEAGVKQFKGIKTIQDLGRGKSAAMNLAIREARGDKIIFSDGDVAVDNNAVEELLKIPAQAVSGRPMPDRREKRTKFAYWQQVLFDTAHRLRLARDKENKFLLLSGYLFLVNKDILDNFKFPEGLLTEDEYLSYYLYSKDYKIKYAPQAKVKVKYPDNYSDWVKQKVRTLAGGYQIPLEWRKKTAMRSF